MSTTSSTAGWSTLLSTDTAAGERVTADTAKQVTAVMACVRVLSEAIASLPLVLYRRLPNGGKERVVDHPIHDVVVMRPNGQQTGFEFREMLQSHLALRGNAYALIDWDYLGRPIRLWPLHPDRISVESEGGRVTGYQYADLNGQRKRYPVERILHLRGLSEDGVKGLSPVQYAARAIGVSLATDKFGEKFFANGARASGALKHPGVLSDTAIQRLRRMLAETISGQNMLKPLVLEEGAEWQQLSINPDEAQFLETRKYQVADIARIFRIPPHMIGDLERATFSNITEQSIEFVQYSLLPWLRRWELRLNAIFLDNGRKYFLEFLVDGLLRGKPSERTEALAKQFMHGALTLNEWRAIENRNPVEGGDEHYVPANLARLGEGSQVPQAILDDAAERLSSAHIRAADRSKPYDAMRYVSRVLDPISMAYRQPWDHKLATERCRLAEQVVNDCQEGWEQTIHQIYRDMVSDVLGAAKDEIRTDM